MSSQRSYSLVDQLLSQLDTGLRTVFSSQIAQRENPAKQAASDADDNLSKEEKELAGRFMRINHAGEVSAQGLYQGQALTAKLPHVRTQMEQAAEEENDHLAWCKGRAHELGTHTSLLDPFWYLGSVTIGAVAGLAGDKWSLGFVAETEHQVVRHLDGHLEKLSEKDQKSRAILEQMKVDELSHATTALSAGGAELPNPIKLAMKLSSKVMTKTAYWL